MAVLDFGKKRTIHTPKPWWAGSSRTFPSFSFSTALLMLGAFAVVGLILLVPAYLLIRMNGAWAETLTTFSSPRTWLVVWNTVLLTTAVTAGTIVIAVPLAWFTTCTNLPGRKIWAIFAALPLVIPSYIGAYLFTSLFSPTGTVQQLLSPLGVARLPKIYGFPGAFLVLTLMTYPYVFLTVRASLRRMDPALIEASLSLGQTGWQTFWKITLPYIRPGITAGGLLVGLYTMRDFGAVTIMQYNTFTRIIYNRYVGYRLNEAAAMGVVLILLTAVLLYFEFSTKGKAQYARTSIGVARKMAPISLGKWTAPVLLFLTTVVFWALFVPTAGLSYWFWRGWQQDFGVANLAVVQSNTQSLLSLIEPALNSFTASSLGALAAMGLALPIAILVVRKPSRISRLFERFTYASFAMPGIVVALAYVFFGTQYASSMYQTLPMLIVAYVILFIPQAVGSEKASLMQVSASLEEAGRSLGKRPFTILRQITLPLVKPGVLAGGALVFLTAMKELPATLILSPLGFNTLSAQIWTNINEAFFARAAAPTLLLLLLSALPLAWLTLKEHD